MPGSGESSKKATKESRSTQRFVAPTIVVGTAEGRATRFEGAGTKRTAKRLVELSVDIARLGLPRALTDG